MEPTNLISSLGGIVLTGIITFLIARSSKKADARGEAEAALIGIGPKIIVEQNAQLKAQNERIDALQEQCNQCWLRELKCRRDLDSALLRIAALEQRA